VKRISYEVCYAALAYINPIAEDMMMKKR